MKIDDVHEGQRVRWRDREGEVLLVQNRIHTPSDAAEDAVFVASEDAGHSRPHIVTPHGVWRGGVRRKRSVLVRLDPAALTDGRGCTYVDHAHYLWCTPSALWAEPSDD